MFDLVEAVLAQHEAIGPDSASEIAKEVCNDIATSFGGRQTWTPARRREVAGLSFFPVTRNDRRIAHALTRASVATVAARYKLSESVVRLTGARVAIEDRAASLGAELSPGGNGVR